MTIMKGVVEASGQSVLCRHAKTFRIVLNEHGRWTGSGTGTLVGPSVTKAILSVDTPQQRYDIFRAVSDACPGVSALSAGATCLSPPPLGPFPNLTSLEFRGVAFSKISWERINQAYPLLERMEVHAKPPTNTSRHAALQALEDDSLEWSAMKYLTLTLSVPARYSSVMLEVITLPNLIELALLGIGDNNFRWAQISSNLQQRSPNLHRLYLTGWKLPTGDWQGFKQIRVLSFKIDGSGSFDLTDRDISQLAKSLPKLKTLLIRHAAFDATPGTETMPGDIHISPASLLSLAKDGKRLVKLHLILDASQLEYPPLPCITLPRFVSLASLSLSVVTSDTGHAALGSVAKAMCPNLVKFKARTIVQEMGAGRYGQVGLMWKCGARLKDLEDIVLRHG